MQYGTTLPCRYDDIAHSICIFVSLPWSRSAAANKRILIISAYFLAAACDKRMRLLTSLYGIITVLEAKRCPQQPPLHAMQLRFTFCFSPISSCLAERSLTAFITSFCKCVCDKFFYVMHLDCYEIFMLFHIVWYSSISSRINIFLAMGEGWVGGAKHLEWCMWAR